MRKPKWGKKSVITGGPDPYAGDVFTRRFGRLEVRLNTVVADVAQVFWKGREVLFASEAIHPWLMKFIFKPLTRRVAAQWHAFDISRYSEMDEAAEDYYRWMR